MRLLPVYLDASALVTLVVPEPESDALTATRTRWPDRVSAAFSHTEVHRALWRTGASRALHSRADAMLETIVLIHLDEPVFTRAGMFKYPNLRSRGPVERVCPTPARTHHLA